MSTLVRSSISSFGLKYVDPDQRALNIHRELKRIEMSNMRGIWKVHSLICYLSNRSTNPFMFGINLNSYLPLW